MTIINDEHQSWIPLPIPPGGTAIKVLKADEANHTVVVKFRFDPGSALPRHYHHARAIAYTVSGHWEYDEGPFSQGMVAYEAIGNEHTPSSKSGAELFVVMISDNGKFLVNNMPDGSLVGFNMKFFKALEGISLEAAMQLDFSALVD